MNIISLYPTINIFKNLEEKFIIFKNSNKIEIPEDADVFFEELSLRKLLEKYSGNFDIDFKHPAYKICNQLLKTNYTISFCIYDFEFDRWMCSVGSEIEWTTQYNDSDIIMFESYDIAECMIPYDESESYAIQIRYFIKNEQ